MAMHNTTGDTDFISSYDFLLRLREDLNDPTFDFFDVPTPHSEDEYQDTLNDLRRFHELIISKRQNNFH